ncbi:MAG: tetratricopeptide repeat protein, partial [Deltaproteobacteria bacterium]|nr:tetratricopeptide repeat protein [Deltaproteobacteria bacterium]
MRFFRGLFVLLLVASLARDAAGEVASPPTLAAAVARAWSTGDCQRVLALVEDPPAMGTPEGVHLAVARCAALGGTLDRALRATGTVPAASPLAPWARRVEAEVLLSGPLGDLGDSAHARRAEALLEGLTLGGTEVRLLRARALVAQHRGLEARDDLRALLGEGGETAAEARYWLARAAEDRGDTEAALATYRASWTREAASPWADRSADRLAALGAPVPDLASAAGRALAAERLTVLARERRAAEALDLLHRIEAAGGPGTDPASLDEPAWLGRRASVCFSGRDYPCAVEAYSRLGSPALVSDPSLLFQHALATSRTGDGAGAAALYRTLLARFPATSEADLASFKIGYLAFDGGRLEEAVDAFRTHLARYPASRYADEARWFAGWCAWRTGEVASAHTWWDRLLSSQPTSSFAPAAAYWRARTKGPDEEERLLGAVLGRYPESAAGWFAAHRLGRSFGTAAAAIPPLPPLPRAWTDAHPAWAAADLLIAAGLDDLARSAIGPGDGGAREADGASRVAIARRLVSLGRVRAARALVGCRGALSADA